MYKKDDFLEGAKITKDNQIFSGFDNNNSKNKSTSQNGDTSKGKKDFNQNR